MPLPRQGHNPGCGWGWEVLWDPVRDKGWSRAWEMPCLMGCVSSALRLLSGVQTLVFSADFFYRCICTIKIGYYKKVCSFTNLRSELSVSSILNRKDLQEI